MVACKIEHPDSPSHKLAVASLQDLYTPARSNSPMLTSSCVFNPRSALPIHPFPYHVGHLKQGILKRWWYKQLKRCFDVLGMRHSISNMNPESFWWCFCWCSALGVIRDWWPWNVTFSWFEDLSLSICVIRVLLLIRCVFLFRIILNIILFLRHILLNFT